MKRPSLVAVLVIIPSLALVACGGGGGSSTTEGPEASTAGGAGGGSAIDFEANPAGHLMFTTMKATGKAGDDTIDLKKPVFDSSRRRYRKFRGQEDRRNQDDQRR